MFCVFQKNPEKRSAQLKVAEQVLLLVHGGA